MKWVSVLSALLSLVVLQAAAARPPRPPCSLPSDFWCDHPAVALACTGSLQYCSRLRASRAGRPTEIDLAFESACPDSQRFVVDRLFPSVVNDANIFPLVSVRAIPWGLAKRIDGHVACHHKERECTGNRLISCLNNQFGASSYTTHNVFNSFMRLMQAKADPEAALRAAAQQSRLAPQAVESIVSCAKGSQSEKLQRGDERATERVLTSTRFVPFIALNGRSHLHMQAVQMMLPSKLKAWKQILSAPNGNAPNSSCNSMPDFWCSSPDITQECFNEAGCRNHQNAVWGRPINLKLVFRSDNQQARSYVMNYVKRYFLSSENSRIKGKATFELEPAASLQNPCGQSSCEDQAVQHCIASKVPDASIRTKMIVCLLEAGGSALESWNSRCHAFLPAVRDSVSECAKSNEWRGELAKRAAAHNAYWPVIPQKNPWLLVNGYSLPSAQFYLQDLHRLVCMWYRGPGHSRDDCSRCEYELTHCLRG